MNSTQLYGFHQQCKTQHCDLPNQRCNECSMDSKLIKGREVLFKKRQKQKQNKKAFTDNLKKKNSTINVNNKQIKKRNKSI